MQAFNQFRSAKLRLTWVLFWLLLCVTSGWSQQFGMETNTPDGTIVLPVSNQKILIQFTKNATVNHIIREIASESRLKKIDESRILPAPKNAVIAELANPLSNSDYQDLLQQLNRKAIILYANPILVCKDGTSQGITNRIAIKLRSANHYKNLAEITKKYDGTIAEQYKYDPLLFFIEIPKQDENALQIANKIHALSYFSFVEVDFVRIMNRFNTNDPFLPNQWSLNNTGTAAQNNGTPGADMRVFPAWGITTGSASIKVAILDEGVDLNHPDLVANMLPGFDGTGLNSGGAPSGNDAHGTACAGIVAAVGNNNLGIAGVAYGSKIIPIRIAYSSGSSWITQNSWIGTCLDWAWQTAGADILSNSWGGGSASALINDPINRSVTQGRGGLGAPVLFAAGNSNAAVSYPATLPNVISVVAMSMCNQRKTPTSCDGENWWGSNFGVTADIAAPGVKIYTTDISGSAGYSSGDYAPTFNGTSSACPNAAGVMALILSVNPGLNATQARQIIESTCEKVGGYTYSANVANQPNGTWSSDLGYGRVNAFAAVQLANPQPCTNPPAVASAQASPSSVCGTGIVSLSLSGISLSSGQTYQWQSSADNSVWTNLNGQTNFSIATTVSTTTWFRCLVSCGTTVASNSVQVTIINPTITSFPHTQNFDSSSSLPCGWTVENTNNDNRTWAVGTTSPRSAPNNIVYNYSTTTAANDWIFTPPLNLEAGKNYRIRFWYRARSASFPEKLEVKWGATANAAGMTSAAIFTNSNIANTTYIEGSSASFSPAANGIQHIGFRVFSDADEYDLYLDDIVIEEVPTCTVPTVAGAITGPTTATAGSPVQFSYTGGNGTSLNWQIATGAGGFNDIASATANNYTLSTIPGTYQIRTRVSRLGCPDAFSNAISIVINPRLGDNINIPILINSLPFTTTNSTIASNGFSSTYTGTNAQSSADVFYRFTTTSCTDQIRISSCGSNFDTYLHLLSATGTWIVSNDDNGPVCTGAQASLVATVLPNTTYIVVIEGFNTATGNFNLNITELDNTPFTASISANGPTTICANETVVLTASTGSSYLWNTGATTASISVNSSGTYQVTVTDTNGCTATASQIVTVNPLPSVSITAAGPTALCEGASVSLTANGLGTYLWSTGESTQSITVSNANNYSVTVTSDLGCTQTANISITQPSALTATSSQQNVSCYQENDGTASVVASGGTSPYTYVWSPSGGTAATASGLAPGNYSVTITDFNGCSIVRNFTITEPFQTVWNGTSWSNGLPAAGIKAVFNANYSITADMAACGVVVNTGATVTLNSNFDLTVDGKVQVATGGLLIVENNANLIQVRDVANTGAIQVKRQASMRRLDYVYWSSPVANQNLLAFSPLTMTNRFYTLNEVTNNFEQINPSTNTFDLAKGYMIRAPNTFPTTPQTFNGLFQGVPNNGNAAIGVTVASSGNNLIGNPYPSTVNAVSFLNDNPGTIYFWTHSQQGATAAANYASFNLSGGTAATAGGPTPNGSIQVGQGFILKKSAAGTATFTNSMRTGNNQNQFFRENIERHRFWLNLSAENQPVNQILIGYIQGASNGIDASYDGTLLEGTNALASVIDGQGLVIQARALPFANTDQVPLRFVAAQSGSYSISIDHFDGVFAEGQAIYVHDAVSGITHNLSESAYNFITEAGSFDQRFTIVYQAETLGVGTITKGTNVLVTQNQHLELQAQGFDIAKVEIYDLRGRLLYSKAQAAQARFTATDIQAETQIVLVKIYDAQNEVYLRKFPFKN